MSPYDIIYTKTYALAQIPHTTCAGPSASLGLLRKYFGIYARISRNRADTIHTNEMRTKVLYRSLT
jgi:hypothetical protein